MNFLFKVKSLSLFIFCFLLFFSLGFYIYYLYKYPKPSDISRLLKYYPKDFILQTGGQLQPPNSRIQHFLNFSPAKKQGTIRIGAFGDSHTFGSEVDKTEAYPHQLQELFNKQFPNKKIEVLNFGISGVGFQEQFFLWEKYAKNYELDYILFGPRGFYADRDVTFRENWNNFNYPKMRFILSNNNKLKRVHIKGSTPEERHKNYYKLIPSWTALRYDKKPFQIWGKFFPSLRHKFYNPFYYKKMSDEEESMKINILLLEKMKNLHDKKILFFTDHNSSMFNNYPWIEKLYNLNFIQFKKNSLYRVFAHKSSLGNEIIAKIYFNALMGKKDFSLRTINCYFKDINSISEKFDRDLHSVQSIQITDENITFSSFRGNSYDHHYKKNKGSYANHKTKGTKTFIAFSDKFNFLESPFIPLPIPLKEGMKIYIQLRDKNKMELGSIKSLDTYEKFFIFYGNFIKRDATAIYNSHFSLLKAIPSFLKKKIKKINSPLELFVEDYKLGTLEPYSLYGKESLKFMPVNGYKNSFLMMGPSHHIREKDLPSELPLYIQYNMNNGEAFKSLIPDWKCKKETRQIHLKLPNFEPLN